MFLPWNNFHLYHEMCGSILNMSLPWDTILSNDKDEISTRKGETLCLYTNPVSWRPEKVRSVVNTRMFLELFVWTTSTIGRLLTCFRFKLSLPPPPFLGEGTAVMKFQIRCLFRKVFAINVSTMKQLSSLPWDTILSNDKDEINTRKGETLCLYTNPVSWRPEKVRSVVNTRNWTPWPTIAWSTFPQEHISYIFLFKGYIGVISRLYWFSISLFVLNADAIQIN